MSDFTSAAVWAYPKPRPSCDMRDGTGACLCGSPQPDCLWFYNGKDDLPMTSDLRSNRLEDNPRFQAALSTSQRSGAAFEGGEHFAPRTHPLAFYILGALCLAAFAWGLMVL